MLKATIHLTRETNRPSEDDVISISEVEDTRDLFSVTFRTPDFSKKKVFVTTEARVLDYIEDILSSLEYDSDPFQFVQVDSVIHPAILYHTSDLDDGEIRDRIVGMIRMALRTDVESA
jgi:hypothetical protein